MSSNNIAFACNYTRNVGCKTDSIAYECEIKTFNYDRELHGHDCGFSVVKMLKGPGGKGRPGTPSTKCRRLGKGRLCPQGRGSSTPKCCRRTGPCGGLGGNPLLGRGMRP